MQNMQLLADPKKIQAFLNDLKDSNHISIDIEFMRRNTYFPEPCVMQISNGKIHILERGRQPAAPRYTPKMLNKKILNKK